jgi:hypothetical protein
MDWCGSSTPETPEYQPINGKRHGKKHENKISKPLMPCSKKEQGKLTSSNN